MTQDIAEWPSSTPFDRFLKARHNGDDRAMWQAVRELLTVHHQPRVEPPKPLPPEAAWLLAETLGELLDTRRVPDTLARCIGRSGAASREARECMATAVMFVRAAEAGLVPDKDGTAARRLALEWFKIDASTLNRWLANPALAPPENWSEWLEPDQSASKPKASKELVFLIQKAAARWPAVKPKRRRAAQMKPRPTDRTAPV